MKTQLQRPSTSGKTRYTPEFKEKPWRCGGFALIAPGYPAGCILLPVSLVLRENPGGGGVDAGADFRRADDFRLAAGRD